MKRLFLGILLLIISVSSFGQNGKYSIEFSTGYIYYFMKNHENNLNFEVSFLPSYKITNSTRIKLGVSYVSKNYFYETEPSNFNDSLAKMDFQFPRLSFPILVSYIPKQNSNIWIGINTGFIINAPLYLNVTEHYANKASIEKKRVDEGQKTGFSYRLGIDWVRKLNDKFDISLVTYFEYKLVQDSDNRRPSVYSIPEDKLKIGFNFSIQYNFCQ